MFLPKARRITFYRVSVLKRLTPILYAVFNINKLEIVAVKVHRARGRQNA